VQIGRQALPDGQHVLIAQAKPGPQSADDEHVAAALHRTPPRHIASPSVVVEQLEAPAPQLLAPLQAGNPEAQIPPLVQRGAIVVVVVELVVVGVVVEL
jgi:hypothetical protein